MTRLLVVIVDALLFKLQINTYGWWKGTRLIIVLWFWGPPSHAKELASGYACASHTLLNCLLGPGLIYFLVDKLGTNCAIVVVMCPRANVCEGCSCYYWASDSARVFEKELILNFSRNPSSVVNEWLFQSFRPWFHRSKSERLINRNLIRTNTILKHFGKFDGSPLILIVLGWWVLDTTEG